MALAMSDFRSLNDIFVGRNREIDLARNIFANASKGQGSILIVDGDPGVGKSRLVSRMSQEADGFGLVSLWGRCYDGQANPPYWPWIETLFAYQRDHEKRHPANPVPSIDATLGLILPTSDQTTQSGQSADQIEQSGFLICDRVIRFFENAAEINPLLFLLEDIHNADAVSFQLLETTTTEVPSTTETSATTISTGVQLKFKRLTHGINL